ncbi:MAG: SPOR domain-containing protein [Flavobacteriaceae bacterium]|nr:MAG: SPOR domain-containing protein [Bacteroidota bacterium]|tara:strand:- start:2461 stop:3333 length:873 start_codon:yes stop_codon:yes gene_type:complete
MKISNHIFNLLHEHDCVIIPGFGAFVSRNISAKISVDKTKIFPPNKEISFNKNLVKNDGLLINNISLIENISYELAEKKLINWVSKSQKRIEKNRYFEIKNIGSISLENSKYIFTPNQNSIFLKESFGLNSIDSSEVLREKPSTNNSYLKYAAIFIVFLALTGIFSKNYIDSINKFNEESYAQANAEIEQKIQKATFSIKTSLPIVKLPIKKQYGNFHIIAGSFRLEENSAKKINQLKNKGFIEARKVGVNKFGLFQVAFNSYDTVDDARLALAEIRLDEDINAWLLIKN